MALQPVLLDIQFSGAGFLRIVVEIKEEELD
jgi:hypothetical protein